MAKYRKKRVVVDAIQFDGENGHSVAAALFPEGQPKVVLWYWNHLTKALDIRTLEGTMTAERGDWIIKGVKGEVYPCKPDIFDLTYESVDGE